MPASATFDEVVERFRESGSNSERGTRFEELMVDFFELDPILSSQYTNVSRWIDWAHRSGVADTGIDLVAQDRATGRWTAIQCKFYEPDHYLSKGDIDSFFTASGKKWDGVGFDNRIIVSTTDRWSKHAEEALDGQQIPVQRLGLEDLAASPIDWAFTTSNGLQVEVERAKRFSTLPHQDEAIDSILTGFESHQRGQWISACGTGKTFTSLKLAERLAASKGGSLRVLFLAPSIQLVAQTLREWTAQTAVDLRSFVVCSDTKASRAAEDISPHDLPLPATTDAAALRERLASGKRAAGLSVVFSTYQSIDVVADAQRLGADAFDLILCDEAHRTTGVQLAGENESAFTRVHDGAFLRSDLRLYMTATPRMFGEDVKNKADEHSAVLSSMDDESVFGPVFHRLGFGEAVERQLLTDYKVMVLAVAEEQMAAPMQLMQATSDVEIPLSDAAKIMGCWNTLAKRTHAGDPHPAFGPDEAPMKRAVGFLENIKSSKLVAEAFEAVVEARGGYEATQRLACDARHVDGTMNALFRAEQLSWLKAPIPEGQCRILTNARCLTEGVDVPALDAVMFLSPRNSSVDVVQAVGRVMRKAPGKEFGYIILPVAVPVGVEPADALRDNKRFRVVWDVLNALRAHDDRFESIVQAINLNGGRDTSGKIIVDVPDQPSGDASAPGVQLPLFDLEQWRDAIYSRIVDRVGTREYWDQWAKDVAEMSAAQVARIEAILAQSSPEVTAVFDRFLDGLRGNLNDGISRDDAISMLSQHLITAPVFDALFGGSGFASSNPVSLGMQEMLDILEGQGLDAETSHLKRFYASVRDRAAAVTDTAGRQQVIHDLYEKFFKNAFPKQAESLGVVYTPVEVVDFILRSADELSRRHFGQGLTDPGVNILDPFTGTGTFIVRLLASGIIRSEDLARKYASELWCNEIMLLAYYIACVNIEATYEALTGADEYVPFPGATMTDTFQISEHGDRADTSLLPANNERITRQLSTPITVIVANPPYSVGQTSENDDNANLRYPSLDARIADTYAAKSTAQLKNSLYDSYIRAYRWATDRLGERGVVGFVSNGGWLDGNTADGMRLSMAEEFSELWVFNLRGNARTAGELRRKEKDNVFGQGARTTIAIVLGVKDPAHAGPATIHYLDIGDYLTRPEKLEILSRADLACGNWRIVAPNSSGDWLAMRNDEFMSYPPLGRDGTAIFAQQGNGLKTNRDSWVYGFGADKVLGVVRRLVDEYNSQLDNAVVLRDAKKIAWSGDLLAMHERGTALDGDAGIARSALYRPFTRQVVYYDPSLINRVGVIPKSSPTPGAQAPGLLVIEPNPRTPFAVLASCGVVDSKIFMDAAQFYPRWTFEPGPKRAEHEVLFGEDGELVDGYRRVDNITDAALERFRTAFGSSVTKDQIFTYVYGVLHSQQYRDRFAADLKKMLPRIPLAASLEDFTAFAEAGQRLMDLHIDYEKVEPWPLTQLVTPPAGADEYETFAVTSKKMKFASKTDKSRLIYSPHVTISGIPDEAHRYQLGSRSALEWIIDRYWIKTDKASGIVNDPNDWSREHNDPRYIIDLIGRVVRVSVETMDIVDSLPALPLGGETATTPGDVEAEPVPSAAREASGPETDAPTRAGWPSGSRAP